MKKISTKSAAFLGFTIVHIIVLILILLFCSIKYEVSDDFVRDMLLSGVYTDGAVRHLMFSNIIYGTFLSFLYNILPGISWYFIIQTLIGFLSFETLAFVLTRKAKWYYALGSVLLILAMLGKDIYVLPQFTKTPVLAICAGGILFAWSLIEHKRKVLTVLGGILLLVGVMIRFNTVYISGLFLVIYLIYGIIRWLKAEKVSVKKCFLCLVLPVIILICVTFGLKFINMMSYNISEDYRFYQEFSKVRAKIVDYPKPEYYECEEAFRQAGISENDYNLIIQWSFADPDYFTLEKMKSFAEVCREYRHERSLSISKFLDNLRERDQMLYPCCICLALLMIWGLAVNRKRGWYILAYLAAVILLLAIYMYIERSNYRVEFGAFAAAVFTMPVIVFDESARKMSLKDGIIPAVLLLFIMGYEVKSCIPNKMSAEEQRQSIFFGDLYYSWNYSNEKYKQNIIPGEPYKELMEEFSSHPENIYYLCFGSTVQSFYYNFPVWESPKDVFPENAYYFGGVMEYFPTVAKSLADKGIYNKMKSLVEDNVYYVSNYMQFMVLQHLQEHYYPDAMVERTAEIDGYQIWKYTAGN